MGWQDYKKEYLDEIRADAAINSTDSDTEFLRRTLEMLEEIGELTETNMFFFSKKGRQNRNYQMDAYAFDSAEKSISMIITDFVDSYDTELLNNSQIETLYNKVFYLLDEMCNSEIGVYCDDSDEIIKLSKHIKYKMSNEIAGEAINKIKIYILTNKKLSNNVKKLKVGSLSNRPVEVNIWDIERIYEVENSQNNEPIVINFKNDFCNDGIPCVKANIGENLNYEAYTAVISGEVLASIYIEHGSRILEGNVRAFLGTSGNKSVNAGIKNTIVCDPSKFFIYNNGIATTASNLEVIEKDGELLISQIEDLQIINGGQTTASLASIMLNPPKGLSKNQILDNLKKIYVPMKLTVIRDRETVDESGVRLYDNMVQKISRFANTQNPVKSADFFSNSPFHIYMEKLSKKYLAPPAMGSPIPTGWYYERSRKKYQQEQIKMSESEKKRFQEKFPNKGSNKQLITKELLAKCLYCAEMKPHIVAKGNNWIMKDFGNSIDNLYKLNKSFVNEYYFKTCVAKVILFKTVDNMVAKAPWYQTGGYKLNIVPYTISKIIHSVPKGYSIDWMQIWNKQMVYPSLIREIEIVSKITNDFIQDSHGVIVTEYCKKLDTWESFKEIKYSLSQDNLNNLINEEIINSDAKQAEKDQKQTSEINDEVEVYNFGASNWQTILDFATTNNLINSKESDILIIAANMEKTGKTPTSKQAKILLEIKDKIENEGFKV